MSKYSLGEEDVKNKDGAFRSLNIYINRLIYEKNRLKDELLNSIYTVSSYESEKINEFKAHHNDNCDEPTFQYIVHEEDNVLHIECSECEDRQVITKMLGG